MIITKTGDEIYKVELENIDLDKVDHIFGEMFKRNASKINKHVSHLKKRDILANLIVDEILTELVAFDKLSIKVAGVYDFTMYLMNSSDENINGIVFSFE